MLLNVTLWEQVVLTLEHALQNLDSALNLSPLALSPLASHRWSNTMSILLLQNLTNQVSTTRSYVPACGLSSSVKQERWYLQSIDHKHITGWSLTDVSQIRQYTHRWFLPACLHVDSQALHDQYKGATKDHVELTSLTLSCLSTF